MSGSVNKVILIGNVGQDPEIRSFQSGGKVCNLSIATSERWKDRESKEQKERTQWHRVVVFNENLINLIEMYVKKGSKLFIEGQLETRKWTDASGQEKYSTEVVLRNFKGELTFLDSRPSNNDNDSLISLYRNLDTLTQYRARTISQDLSFSTSSDITFNLDFIDTTYHGVYAIEYNDSHFYMLGLDTTHNDIIIITNNTFQITSLDTIPDSTVVGLSFKGNDLFLSYRNRRIEKWKTY